VNRHIIRRRASLIDLDQAADYLQQQRGASVAIRFLRAAEAAFEQLANTPGIGLRYEPENPLFDGVRFSPISRFKKYLVFYKAFDDGVEILRILHGARDIQGLLADGFESPDDEVEEDDELAPPPALP
jgi:toxin ParE1/3/4